MEQQRGIESRQDNRLTKLLGVFAGAVVLVMGCNSSLDDAKAKARSDLLEQLGVQSDTDGVISVSVDTTGCGGSEKAAIEKWGKSVDEKIPLRDRPDPSRGNKFKTVSQKVGNGAVVCVKGQTTFWYKKLKQPQQ